MATLKAKAVGVKKPFEVIHIRTRDACRVFNSLTHPTDQGSSVLSSKSTTLMSPLLPLVLDILREEYGATITYESAGLDAWLDTEPLPMPTPVKRRQPSIIDLDDTVVPLPKIVSVMMTFTMKFEHATRPTGPVDRVHFADMAFSLETPSQRMPHNADEHREATRDDLETTGIRRIPHQHAAVREEGHRRDTG